MKKILLILLALLLISGAAGAVYYFYFMSPDNSDLQTSHKPVLQEPAPEGPQAEDSGPDPTEYFVITQKANVYLEPDDKAVVNEVLYKGDSVEVFEKKHDWIRISEYWAVNNDENSKVEANWININTLSITKPEITTAERRETIAAAIALSDDYQSNKEAFITATDKLLKEATCHWTDFEALQGWVRSTHYKERNVYFVYCGGMRISDKIYLDVRTGETFTAPLQ